MNANDLPFKSATTERQVSEELRTCIRRIVARDPGMACRREPGAAPLSNEEQEAVILDLLKSVDENAHRRGMAENLAPAILQLQQGDTLVVMAEQRLTEEQGARTKERVQDIVGDGVPVLVLGGGLGLEVLRQDLPTNEG